MGSDPSQGTPETPGTPPWAQTRGEKRSTLPPHHPSGLSPPAQAWGDLGNICHCSNVIPSLHLLLRVLTLGLFGKGTFPTEKGGCRTFPGQLEGQRLVKPHAASPALPGFGGPSLGAEGPSLLWVWGFRAVLSTGRDLTAKPGLIPAPGQGLSPGEGAGPPQSPLESRGAGGPQSQTQGEADVGYSCSGCCQPRCSL